MISSGLGAPSPPVPDRVRPLAPEPPRWVRDLFGDRRDPSSETPTGMLREARQGPLLRLTARIDEAASLDADELSAEVARRYTAIAAALAEHRRHPVRLWNYVPGIVEPLGGGLDRYMAFNRGRYQAYADQAGSAGRFERAIPTASAVGITAPDLVIDCLATDEPGTPIENPRQIASWRYSRRYGPRPPCFARGTVITLDGQRRLLLGGTASIVGEESRHHGDRQAQVDEILTNMDALIANAARTCGLACAPGEGLARLANARIYVVHADDAGYVAGALEAAVGRPLPIEIAVARVCRPELLVEIEGVACMKP